MTKQFFNQQSKEINEWRIKLRGGLFDQRKDVIKRVIRAMTYGRDVSSLFQEMVHSCDTQDIETKKLVYLYLMNYARLKPDITIRVINIFSKDTRDPNPIIRGIAIRSMSSLRVDKIVEHLIEPLQRCARDTDAYVRKCAALSIAKLFELDPEVTIDKKFVGILNEMLTDQVPMVVANAVAALTEICDNSKMIDLTFKKKTIKILLQALKECTEWGQIYILDSVANYKPSDGKETDMIIEQVIPRMQHANSAVVLSSVKVIIRMMEHSPQNYSAGSLMRKMSGPLVTLLNNPPEIQFVALKNISLIVQRYPSVLSKQIKMFFCKYDDPIYVKLQKIDIMVRLSNLNNINQVILEFKDYAQGVDVQFVRKAVRAIGRCAIKIEEAAQTCVDILVELINRDSKYNYIVQEAVIVIKDIFRKYPNRYEAIIKDLCENLDTLDEPEAKASMIWIIGEYSNRIVSPETLLELFVETFLDEPPQVQLALLTSCVKLYLKVPSENSKELLKIVIDKATKNCDNPDVRDRAYIYWRIVHEKTEVSRSTVLGNQERISESSDDVPENLLDTLLENISSLSSVYGKPPEMFVPKTDDDDDDDDDDESDDEEEGEQEERKPKKKKQIEDGEEEDGIPEEDDDSQYEDSSNMKLDDLLGFGMSEDSSPSSGKTFKHPQLLSAESGDGLSIYGKLMKESDGELYFDFTFMNESDHEMSGFGCKIDKNPWGIGPKSVRIDIPPLIPGNDKSFKFPVVIGEEKFLREVGAENMHLNLKVAVKYNKKTIVFFQEELDLSVLFVPQKEVMRQEELMLIWETAPSQLRFTLTNVPSPEKAFQLCAAKQIQRVTRDASKAKFSAKLFFNNISILILFEISFQGEKYEVFAKSPEQSILSLFDEELAKVLGAQVEKEAPLFPF